MFNVAFGWSVLMMILRQIWNFILVAPKLTADPISPVTFGDGQPMELEVDFKGSGQVKADWKKDDKTIDTAAVDDVKVGQPIRLMYCKCI